MGERFVELKKRRFGIGHECSDDGKAINATPYYGVFI
jgi:hypothetical protein